MRRWLWALGLWCLASSASAQVQEGELRVWLDSALVDYDRLHVIENGEWRVEHDLGIGPQAISDQGVLPGPLGYGVGYVANAHLIPQLALSFGYRRIDIRDGNGLGGSSHEAGPSAFGFMASPRLEVPFNPRSKVVVGALIGADFRLRRARYNPPDTPPVADLTLGFGPALGVTSHFFVVPNVSVDVSVLGLYDFLYRTADRDVLPDYENYQVFTLGMLLGASLWP